MRPVIEEALLTLRSAWRFRWAALGCAWIVAILGWAVVFALPGRYDTHARIYVDTTSLLGPLLEGLTVGPNTAGQVELVRRALVGRPQLEHVVDTTGLRDRARSPAEREALVIDLTEKIRITGDLQSRNFQITYSDADPQISYSVVQSLLDSFVEQSLQANRTDSANAQNFLLTQLRDYEQRLTESERRLADFKRTHIGSMPDDRGGYFERFQSEMTELDRLSAALSVATHRRDELRQRLLGRSRTGDESVPVATSADGRLAEARGRLDDLLLRYTEIHPDVVALQETIASLEKQRQRELESLQRNVDALGAPRANSGSLVAQNLQIALNEVEVELASIRVQMADRQQRVAELRASINTLPQVEAELTRLNRDYGINRAQYDALLQRLESARLSEQAQKTQEVIFKIVDPPVLPLLPAAPNRLLLAAGVLMAALGAGGGLAWFLSQLRPVFLTADEIRKAFSGLQVIGTIGAVRNGRAIARERLGWLLFASLAGALPIALGAVVLAHQRWNTIKLLLPGGGET